MLARFNTAVAVKYGLKEAVLFEHIVDRIRYADLWDEPEASDDRALIEDRLWVRASVADLADSLPFMSSAAIRSTLKSLRNSGLISMGKVSGHPYDRANWYALTDLGEQFVYGLALL